MTSPRRTLRRAGRVSTVVLAAALGLSATALVWASSARAAAPDIYDLSANAIALDSMTTDPNIPLGLPFSYGSYGAGSILTSNGESSADAGAPYSPLVSSLPNTGNGVAQSTFGQGLPVVPTFPGYVSAKDPLLPSAQQNAGGYELTAEAVPGRATGKVSIGAQAATSAENNAFAFATSVVGDDGVLSEGSAGLHAFTLDGILDLADVSSYASLTRGADGRTVAVTTTNLGTISFAGLTSGATQDGLTALGSTPTPLNVDSLVALNKALKPAGITLTYLPEIYAYTDGSTSSGPTIDPKRDVSGVMSGALQILFTNTSDRGTTTEKLTFGRVSVTATSTSLGAAIAKPPTGSSESAGGASGPATAAGHVDAAGIGALPGAALPAGTVPTGMTEAAQPMAGPLPSQTFLPAALNGIVREGTTSWKGTYVVLALAAGSTLAGSQIVRFVALRGR